MAATILCASCDASAYAVADEPVPRGWLGDHWTNTPRHVCPTCIAPRADDEEGEITNAHLQ